MKRRTAEQEPPLYYIIGASLLWAIVITGMVKTGQIILPFLVGLVASFVYTFFSVFIHIASERKRDNDQNPQG